MPRHFRRCENGWVVGRPSLESIEQARVEQARRDAEGGWHFDYDADTRWIGMLGERALGVWLAEEDVPYAADGGYLKHDVVVNGVSVSIKTSRGKPRPDFANCVPAHQVEKGLEDEIVFLVYDLAANRIYVVGGCCREDFLARARRVAKGGEISEGVRAFYPCSVVRIAELASPDAWVQSLYVRSSAAYA